MHYSCGINFCANTERAFYFLELSLDVPRRVCTPFRLFSWYSSSHFPLCSFRIVKYDCRAFLPTPVIVHTTQIHTRLSTACFRVSYPVGWHWGEFAVQYIYRIKPTLRLLFGDFCIGALANASGGSSHRHVGTSSNRAEIENLFDISGCRARFVLARQCLLTARDRTGSDRI